MMSGRNLKSSAEVVTEIVDRTRVLVDRLRCAIIHQDNLTKDCFHTNATELSKTVESIKKSYLKLEEEYRGVEEEIQMGEERLSGLSGEYKKILEENVRLKETEDRLLNSKNAAFENKKLASDLRETLRAYKLLTGVRFDFSDSANALTGYVAISGNKPSNSTIIPFEIDTSNGDEKKLLWDKIGEAALEICE